MTGRPRFRRTIRRNRAVFSIAAILMIILIVVSYSFVVYGSLTPEPGSLKGTMNEIATGRNASASYVALELNLSSPTVLDHTANVKISIGSAPAAVLSLSGSSGNRIILYSYGGYTASVTNPYGYNSTGQIFSGAVINITYDGAGTKALTWNNVPIELTYFGLTGGISSTTG